MIISIMMLLKITQLKLVDWHEHCGGGGGTLGMFSKGGGGSILNGDMSRDHESMLSIVGYENHT